MLQCFLGKEHTMHHNILFDMSFYLRVVSIDEGNIQIGPGMRATEENSFVV